MGRGRLSYAGRECAPNKGESVRGPVPVLVGRIITSLLVSGGSQIVHSVVNKARDPLAGVLEV